LKTFNFLGAKVIIGCRNTEKGEQAAQEIRNETGRQVVIYPLDLADFKSVRAFAKVFQLFKV
jgi:retinol dehydrogenase-12